MCKSNIKVCLFLFVLTLSSIVHATGLGKFTLNSYLGQALKAEIDLVSVRKEDISSLKVTLASRNIFSLANVDYISLLDTFEFSIQNRANGQPYVKIISSEPVTDSSFNMLVKLDWPAGNLIREYLVHLEPPDETIEPISPEIQISSGSQGNIKSEQLAAKRLDSAIDNFIDEEAVTPASIQDQEAEEVIASLPEAESGKMAVSERGYAATTYGPVENGDTLFRIAQEEISYKVQLNQLLVALHRANPQAFSGNNMNRLKTGFMLHIPDENQVAAISPDVADKEVKIHTENWEAYRLKLAAETGSVVSSAVGEESSQTTTGKITAIMIDDDSVEATHANSEGLLRLSKGEQVSTEESDSSEGGAIGGIQEKFNIVEENAIAGEKALNEAKEHISLIELAIEENRIANKKVLNEANQRIIALEKNIKDMQTLLERIDSTNAKVQAGSIEEESNPTIMTWLLLITIFLLTAGLWWKIQQSRVDDNPKISDTADTI